MPTTQTAGDANKRQAGQSVKYCQLGEFILSLKEDDKIVTN